MKKSIFYFVLISLIVAAYSCSKADKSNNLLNDEVYLSHISETIEQSTRISVKRITKVEDFNCTKGVYRVIDFVDAEGIARNFIEAGFLFNTVSEKLEFSKESSDKLGDVTSRGPSWCYEYWCTSGGNCTECGVRVSDPFGSPTLSCTCSACSLHTKQTDCSNQ